MRFLALLLLVLLTPVAASAQLAPFEAGEHWAGFRSATPKGEQFCLVALKDTPNGGLMMRQSKLGSLLSFSDGTERQVKEAAIPVTFHLRRAEGAPLGVKGRVVEKNGPGGTVIYFYEGPSSADFLDPFAAATAVSMEVRGKTLGPLDVPGIAEALKALRACVAAL